MKSLPEQVEYIMDTFNFRKVSELTGVPVKQLENDACAILLRMAYAPSSVQAEWSGGLCARRSRGLQMEDLISLHYEIERVAGQETLERNYQDS